MYGVGSAWMLWDAIHFPLSEISVEEHYAVILSLYIILSQIDSP
jgi:hypothetical protein